MTSPSFATSFRSIHPYTSTGVDKDRDVHQRIGRPLIYSQKIEIIFNDVDLQSEKITFFDLDQ